MSERMRVGVPGAEDHARFRPKKPGEAGGDCRSTRLAEYPSGSSPRGAATGDTGCGGHTRPPAGIRGGDPPRVRLPSRRTAGRGGGGPRDCWGRPVPVRGQSEALSSDVSPLSEPVSGERRSHA